MKRTSRSKKKLQISSVTVRRLNHVAGGRGCSPGDSFTTPGCPTNVSGCPTAATCASNCTCANGGC